MRLDRLGSIEFRYLDAHFPKPYGDQSGPGWGIGEGTVSGTFLVRRTSQPNSKDDEGRAERGPCAIAEPAHCREREGGKANDEERCGERKEHVDHVEMSGGVRQQQRSAAAVDA